MQWMLTLLQNVFKKYSKLRLTRYTHLMDTVHVLTGENEFELLREKRRWIAEFARKFGEDACTRIDAGSVTIRNLLDEVSVLPFLAEKRLIVIDGIPRSSKEEIDLLLQAVHPSTIVLFVDTKPDKRSGGVKELLKVAAVRTYLPLKGAPLVQWVLSCAAEHGITLDPPACRLLLEYTGDDQNMLAHELEKLSVYRQAQKVSTDDIEALCVPTEEGVIWKISDLLSTGSKADALRFAHRLLSRGGDAYGLWAILSSMLKNLIAVHAASDAGIASQNDIAEATGVHPFAVRSLLQYSRRLDAKRTSGFVRWVADSDRALKTGSLRATDEAPQEIVSLIDAFILKSP